MKLFRTIAVYVLLIIGITVAINAAYMKRDTTWDFTDKYKSMPDHIQICNFGPSHGAASFEYTELEEAGYTCFNFAGGRQMPTYDVRILKAYIDCLEPGGHAFIVIAYPSFYGESELEWEEFSSYNNTYYRILPNDLIQQYDPKVDFYVSYFPSLRAGFDLFRVLFGKGDEPPDPYAGADPQVVKDSVYKRYETYVKNIRGILNRDWVDSIYEMIALLQENDITPVMVSTPVMVDFSAFVHEQDPSFFDDWYGMIDRICADTGIEYYDYSEHPDFMYDYSLFSDADHLNTAGAEKFSHLIAKEVLGIDTGTSR
ncbi:MAG: hypothetical protein IJQ21_04665 [Lachnospiraceae bacterium]|nr:hypothetical protein [Lachnospiraceae bacterium]